MNENPIDALYPDDMPSAPAVDSPEIKPVDERMAEPEAALPAPERYELKLDGLTLDPKLLAEAEPVFRELGLSNKQANALLPIAPKLMESAQEAVIQKLIDGGAKQRTEWLNAFVNDPDIGGAKRGESERLAAKGMAAMGFGKDHPFRAALNETGFGNHPDMIRMLRWIGEMSNQAKPGGGGDVPAWEAMYPNG